MVSFILIISKEGLFFLFLKNIAYFVPLPQFCFQRIFYTKTAYIVIITPDHWRTKILSTFTAKFLNSSAFDCRTFLSIFVSLYWFSILLHKIHFPPKFSSFYFIIKVFNKRRTIYCLKNKISLQY